MLTIWLFFGAGYFNMTAFQMVSVATVFTWLVLFVRAVAAASVPRDEQTSESRALPNHTG